ncbi:MAG TPA: hypothetical protein VG820_06645 [Fimbriimonadaceae bacterium]|nr:hypothetical protein [Fimbriimonadaceae bacterium]
MKRWRVWVLLALLLCVPILLSHSRNPDMLKDSDTAFLVKTIRERQAPLSWFAGDWPLGNHFYRPLPTLTFELDNRLYGDKASGYGWTNAILCALCTLALFWFLAEVSTSPPWAFAGAALFTCWTVDLGAYFATPLYWAAGLLILVGLYRHSFKFRHYLPACLVLCFLANELTIPQMTISSLNQFMIGWLPGRTASVMTLFALLAMATYSRYERSRDKWRPDPEPTATDLPASPRAGKAAVPSYGWLWYGLTLLFVAAALASYEQAVMLPGVLVGEAVFLRLKRRNPNWKAHIPFWLLLGGYFVLRHFLLPAGISQYQAQQFRHGPGVWQDLASYILPNFTALIFFWAGIVESFWMIISPFTYSCFLGVASTVATIVKARLNWQTILAGWALSSLAFLPMAWVKQFGHYHYWPLALRTMLILGVGNLAWKLVVIAASPPALQAPARPSPAPGSLPRP